MRMNGFCFIWRYRLARQPKIIQVYTSIQHPLMIFQCFFSHSDHRKFGTERKPKQQWEKFKFILDFSSILYLNTMKTTQTSTLLFIKRKFAQTAFSLPYRLQKAIRFCLMNQFTADDFAKIFYQFSIWNTVTKIRIFIDKLNILFECLID